MNLRGLVKFLLYRDTTQHGEFALLRKLMTGDMPRIFVDVGANDGFKGSNSYPFIARGWRTLLIEPHPAAFARLQKRFQNRSHVKCLNLACADQEGTLPLFIGIDGDDGTLATLCTDDHPHFRKARTDQRVLVRVERLDTVLTAQDIPHDFGILSVDAEGMDYEVLLGLDLKIWRPRIIITEEYDLKTARKHEHLKRSGYALAGSIMSNTFWMPAEFGTGKKT